TLQIDDTLKGVMIETAKTSSLVFIILLGAAMLTSAFRAFGGEELVKEFLGSLPGGFWAQFVIVMAVIFVLGFFLDFIEIAVVVVPIVAPILLSDPGANVTAVWLGVMIGLNIQTSFLTPPFGFALFYLRGVAPAIVKTVQIYKGVVVFICLQLSGLAIVGFYPALVNYLPERVKLTSDTAPPPVNPGLQYCVEEYVAGALTTQGDDIRASITAAQALDLGMLPKKTASTISDSFSAAEEALAQIAAIKAAETAVADEASTYRPLHRQVRDIEADIRHLDDEIKELEVFASRSINSDASRQLAEESIAEMMAEKEQLATGIPAEWDDVNKAFATLTKAESDARRQYRRHADSAYQPIEEMLTMLSDNDALEAYRPTLTALQQEAPSLEPKAAMERIKEVASGANRIKGADEVGKALSKARRALRGGNPDPEKSAENIADALAALDENLEWRRAADAALRPGLTQYLEAISGTIGLRSQPRLPREQALYVASCRAEHRDISLNF
ncbi:MAG: TRAP transporter large permease subunit, partial [Rhodobacteraceae bacterium]|nr:TRAP transporter large permease subunit [Paracoccaceae bacterium]